MLPQPRTSFGGCSTEGVREVYTTDRLDDRSLDGRPDKSAADDSAADVTGCLRKAGARNDPKRQASPAAESGAWTADAWKCDA